MQEKNVQVEEWMMDTLLSLIEKYSYDKISVKEIVGQAQIARCTFYRHYSNKDDLLLACCKRITAKLAEQMTDDNCKTIYGTALVFFSFWQDNQDFLSLLRKNDLIYFFLKSYDDFMFDISKSVKYEGKDLDGFSFSPKIRYHFFFSINGLWGMVNRWTIYGCKESPEELAQYVIAFLVESYENEPDCQYYDEHEVYPYNPCYIKPGYEF